ncbi:hypothetical protein D3C76_1050850 [compost metagenome]
MITCPCGLDRRIECQQVGLPGDVLNAADNRTDAYRLAAQLIEHLVQALQILIQVPKHRSRRLHAHRTGLYPLARASRQLVGEAHVFFSLQHHSGQVFKCHLYLSPRPSGLGHRQRHKRDRRVANHRFRLLLYKHFNHPHWLTVIKHRRCQQQQVDDAGIYQVQAVAGSEQQHRAASGNQGQSRQNFIVHTCLQVTHSNVQVKLRISVLLLLL